MCVPREPRMVESGGAARGNMALEHAEASTFSPRRSAPIQAQ